MMGQKTKRGRKNGDDLTKYSKVKFQENNYISDFLLKTYQSRKLERNGNISKVLLKNLFQEFLLDNNPLKLIAENVEMLLKEYEYIKPINCGNFYNIIIEKILDYRKKIIKQFTARKLQQLRLQSTTACKPQQFTLQSTTACKPQQLRLQGYRDFRFSTKRYPALKIHNNKLPDFFPCQLVRKSKMHSYSDETLKQIDKQFSNYLCTKEITPENISHVFNVLLQIEDLDVMELYMHLTQKQIIVQYRDGELCVKLDNLSKRNNGLSVLSSSDEVLLLPSGVINQNWSDEHDPVKYLYDRPNSIGNQIDDVFIERVEGNYIYFSRKDYINLRQYDIIFRPSRINYIYQRIALEYLLLNKNIQTYLFPSVIVQGEKLKNPITIYNKNIESNPQQLQAVTNIVNATLNVPYIIYGPPGTGKTTVITECILQLLRQKLESETRILVTAASNAACDEIGKRLCKTLNLSTNTMLLLRIYSKSFEKKIPNIDKDLLKNSNLRFKNQYYPGLDEIKQYKILICTHTVCAMIVQAAFYRYEIKFSHVFVDECASSTEPEALMGIVKNISMKTQLIISGDPMQLGPIINNDVTKKYGLSISLMERLLNRSFYGVSSDGLYDETIQTRLIKNFRSHPEILQFSNKLFYKSELQPCASEDITCWCINWYQLPNPKIPIIFKTVYANAENDPGSKSLYNRAEIKEVLDYVEEIMCFGINGRKILQTDIGIISPYKQQYTRIRLILNRKNWRDIEVGSTEIFQGNEKPIIIISMVRSNSSNVGFLRNPKRLNVLLTRAQALMIIVGNPKTLEKIPQWKYVIDYCTNNKCIVKSKSSKKKRNCVNISGQFGQLKIN